ncbi:MAG: YitT family protein [Erysipelotrichales bacterium]|nr:YitT family protein [Erysipelotrichales bacterium]
MLKIKEMTKKQKQGMLLRVLQIVIGTIILAFGQAVFIEQCELVIGGVASIGNIFNQFYTTPYTVRVTVVVLNIACFLIGIIFLGKKFSAQTLISTIVYTIAYPIISYLMQTDLMSFLRMTDAGITTLLLAGAFGGMISGVGISFCLLGGGSTGGVDVFAILIAKVTHTKVPLWMFVIDSIVVFLGYIIVGNGNKGEDAIYYFLICVLSALLCSLTTEMILSKRNNSYVVNIVSDKWEEINAFIINDLDRGSTIIDVVGGYTMTKRRMIQAAISRNQYSLLLNKISEVDKDAFVTINSAHEINGEGFDDLPSSMKQKKGKK